MDAIGTAVRGGDLDLASESRPELAALRGCPQTATFHAEGDVAVHTGLVYDLAREHADRLTEKTASESADPEADDSGTGDSGTGDPGTGDARTAAGVSLRLAALLHDVGKPATTKEIEPGRWSAHGHDLEGARLVSSLFATHPALLGLPLGIYPSVHALVRAHMWTYAGDRITSGAALRMAQVTDPRLLMALWDSDSRGRICDDPADVADRVAYSGLVLAEYDAARPDGFGRLDQVAVRSAVLPRAWRESFRAVVEGGLTDVGAIAAHLAAAERHSTGASLTYTIGLPGVGKSTWAREVWAPATGGVVLSSEGARRRDRRAAAAHVQQLIPELLAAGRPICVDATHLLRETRDVLVTYAGRYGAELHAVHFRAPLALALRRQRTRPDAAAVPASTITSMAGKLRWPAPDEYQALTVVETNGKSWDYTPRSRWLDVGPAVAEHPVTATPWARS